MKKPRTVASMVTSMPRKQDREDRRGESPVRSSCPIQYRTASRYLPADCQRPTNRSSSFMMAVSTSAMPKYMNRTIV